MTPSNLDLVRAIYADWEHGNFSSTAWAHPDIEFVMSDGPAPGSWKGASAMAHTWRDWLRAWRDVRMTPESHRALDTERVLTIVTASGLGKASGLELDEMATTGATVLHVVNGKVTRFVLYWNRERALADLGLPSGGDADNVGEEATGTKRAK
jgi:ketosteroid isomerase-like protein